MALTRSVLYRPVTVSRPINDGFTVEDNVFRLQVGETDVLVNYWELSKLLSQADAEIRDYLGEEHV